jgi:hypothetical protein
MFRVIPNIEFKLRDQQRLQVVGRRGKRPPPLTLPPCHGGKGGGDCDQPYTDKKENLIFLIYKEIQSGAVAKSYMRKGFLIYEEMRKYFPIHEEAISYI